MRHMTGLDWLFAFVAVVAWVGVVLLLLQHQWGGAMFTLAVAVVLTDNEQEVWRNGRR